MAKTEPFDNFLNEYEQWFIENNYVYESELQAIRQLLPTKGRGIEVGIGSGLFAKPLGITEGCDPSANMLNQATERGLEVTKGVAENLPYMDESVDYALMVTAICFVDNVDKTFKELHRTIKPNGSVVMAFVDKNSPVGKIYQKEKDKSIFYKDATFFSTKELSDMFVKNGFTIVDTVQTVYGMVNEITEVQQTQKGYGEGSFVVIKAQK